MNTDLLNFVRAELVKHKGSFRDVGDASGVPYSTVVKIFQGVTKDPGVLTVQKLADYLAKQKRRSAK